MPQSLSIGTFAGTAVRLHWSFLVFMTVLTIAIYFASGPQAALQAVILFTLLFACVLLHEFGHIEVARLFGIQTPEVMLLPIGGLAKLQRIPSEPLRELAIAIAGPSVNFVLFAGLSLALGRLPGPEAMAALASGEVSLIEQLALFNLVIGLFNLLPAFPMDGGRILRALLALAMPYYKATRVAASIGQGLAIALVIFGFLGDNIILMGVGLFILFAAWSEAQIALVRHTIGGTPVGCVMVTDQPRLAPFDPIMNAADALVHSDCTEFPVVDEDGHLVGILSQRALIEELTKYGPAATVGHAMRRNVPVSQIGARTDEIAELIEAGAPAVAVADRNGRYLGLVTWKNLLEEVAVRGALSKHDRASASPGQV